MHNCPKIVYGAETVQLTTPSPPWAPGVRFVGAGREWSAADVPATWGGTRRYTLSITLRVRESEWPAVRAWLEFAMAGGAFTFYADGNHGLGYPCYLLKPDITDEAQPERDSFAAAYSLQVVLCTANGAPIEPVYYVNI